MRLFFILFGLVLAFSSVSHVAPAQIVIAAWQAPLVSGQRVQVKKLAKNISEVRADIKTSGPSEFQSPANIAKFQKRFTQFKTALMRYPQVNDPDVIEARKQFNDLAKALTDELKRARQQQAKLGDVQQALAQIEANARKYPVPKPLLIPFDEQQAKTWVAAASSARTVAEHNQKQLAFIAPLAYLPDNRGTVQGGAPYDSGDVRRLTSWNSQMFKDLAAGYRAMAAQLERQNKSVEENLNLRLALQPLADDEYRFIGKDAEAKMQEAMDRDLAIIQSALFLETALERPTDRAQSLISLWQRTKGDFAAKRKQALDKSRLPKARSRDKNRLKIAKAILQAPKYEFGPFGRIVLTSDKIITRERKSSEIKLDDVEFKLSGDVTLSGTETSWTYKWQEFTFAVPLQETDSKDWYIWWITAKKFSSGGAQTPIGRWVSGAASRGNQILAENINK